MFSCKTALAFEQCQRSFRARCRCVSMQSGSLTLAAVHLVAVEASEGFGPPGQTHGPGASSLMDAGHRSPQAAVHQRLQRLHCQPHTEKRTSTSRSVSELSQLTALQFSSESSAFNLSLSNYCQPV